MRNAVKLTCVGMLALVAGCSSLNPFASKPAPRNPPATLEDFKQTLGVRAAWSVSVGSAGEFVFSPAVAGNSVFAAAADGTVVRIDANSGRTVWRINTDARLTAGVGSDGNTVAVASEKGMLLALDGDGKVRWKVQASSEILSAPAVGQGVIVVRSVDNRITAYDAETGSRRWAVQRTSPPLTLRSAPGIAVSGTTAYVALPGGRLLALALSNGGARWEVAVGDPRGTTELERIADLSGTPFVAGRDVCAVAYQGRVACFDATSGAPRWAKDMSSEVGVAVDERNVYAADERGAVTALARDTGAGAWRNNKLANRRLSSPVVMSRALAVGDAEGYIHFLSREDGAFLARIPTDGSRVVAASPLSASSAVFQTQAGTIVALATE
jgi:outer membrane protein assembly factor BamB